MECKQYKEQLEKCTIESSVSGKVSDITIVSGSAINQGSELVKVQQGDRKDNVIVCYVALDSGKKITEGMKVLIYPTTNVKTGNLSLRDGFPVFIFLSVFVLKGIKRITNGFWSIYQHSRLIYQ